MSGLEKDEVLETLNEYEAELIGFGVVRIGLFGSFARGEQSGNSDLDFVVELEENSFDDYMGLKLFLEDLFDREVDLVIESDVREELDHVKKEVEYVTPA